MFCLSHAATRFPTGQTEWLATGFSKRSAQINNLLVALFSAAHLPSKKRLFWDKSWIFFRRTTTIQGG